MHNVFISYHHDNDQWYKEELLRMNRVYGIFRDGSVSLGDISDTLSNESIRTKIRDEHLRDTTVTIVLVGTDTWGRKHIDWETHSSMFDGLVNKRSGILVINLPSINCSHFSAGHGDLEKSTIHPETANWISLNRSQYEERYPFMPDRIIDNLVKDGVKMSVVPWEKIHNKPQNLRLLIELAHSARTTNEYDLSRPMRTRDA